MAASQGAVASLALGGFVWTGDDYGIGKVLSNDDRTVAVAFFHSVAAPPEVRSYRLSEIERGYLYPQTRVYVRDGDANLWRVGRVKEFHTDLGVLTYRVDFPNGRSGEYGEADLQVRCLRPAADPSDVLATLGAESQFFHNGRLRLLRALTAARASSRGLTGLVSASVELVPHQVEVVRRVLEDPIQRYLLADEVGMGKTIEAGAIVRQALIDNPTERVLVLVPTALVRQWERELAQKFDIPSFGARVSVLPHEALADAPTADLVVVDEAHHLLGTGAQDDATYARLRELAHGARGVLLLSATPVLGNEAATLALLHLLDPQTYPLEGLEAFRERVRRGEEYGRVLLGLKPGASTFVLRRLLAQISEAFPGDDITAALAGRLAEQLEPAAQEERQVTIRALRRHISETYRIHQRLLRNRRKDTQGWELLPREGRLSREFDQDERAGGVLEVLEDWRYRAHEHAAAGDTDDERALAARYAALVGAFGRGVDECLAELREQWVAAQAGGVATFPAEARVVAPLLGADDAGVTKDAVSLVRLDAIGEAVDGAIREARGVAALPAGRPVKVVAFTSSTGCAESVHRHLAARRGAHATFRVTRGMESDAVDAAVEAFRTSTYSSVMVCDRAGDEGLNFHFAHAIVHLDLPLSPAMLEQRVGRVDRFGRKTQALLNQVLLPSDEDDDPIDAWCELLHRGFGLFDESLSEVQFLLERLQDDVVLALFRRGASGLRGLTEVVREQIAAERLRLDEQHALDDLQADAEEAARLYERLDDAEGDEREFARQTDSWLTRVLQFHRLPVEAGPTTNPRARTTAAPPTDRSVFQLRWTWRTLVPERPWRPYFDASLDRPLAFRRTVATHRPDVRLLRLGHPLFDALQRLLRWDDRGSAFATWRQDPSWPSAERGEWLGFGLCYVVEAGVTHMPEVRERLLALVEPGQLPSLQRRADAFLPPWVESLYVDVDLAEVGDPDVVAALERPYYKGMDALGRRDFNLGSRPEALFDRVDAAHFADLCRQARARSEEKLRASASFGTRLDDAARRAGAELRERNDRLRLRLRLSGRESGAIEREIAVNEALLDAILRPAVRLDAIGFFVLSDEAPVGAPTIANGEAPE